MTTVSNGLVGPLALTGNLALNTAGIEEAMGDNNSITETLAIQVTPSGGNPFTVIQEDITIYNDLIVGAPSVPTPGVSYWTTVQSDARYPMVDPANGNFRFSGSNNIFQIVDSTGSRYRTVWFDTNGVLNAGPPVT
jgi:hypothetical protein